MSERAPWRRGFCRGGALRSAPADIASLPGSGAAIPAGNDALAPGFLPRDALRFDVGDGVESPPRSLVSASVVSAPETRSRRPENDRI